MKRILFLMLVLLGLTSCASNRKMTREEWLEAGRHTYSGIEKETLIKNAEKVLRLADGDDFEFAYKQNGFVASRKWFMYMVIAAAAGTDYWVFEVERQGNDLVATVSVNVQSGTVNGYSAGS